MNVNVEEEEEQELGVAKYELLIDNHLDSFTLSPPCLCMETP